MWYLWNLCVDRSSKDKNVNELDEFRRHRTSSSDLFDYLLMDEWRRRVFRGEK
jgi:hypothetical protein